MIVTIPSPEGFFSCSTQLSTKFKLLIKLTYRQMKNSLRCYIYHVNKCWNANNCWVELNSAWKQFYDLEAWSFSWPFFVFYSFFFNLDVVRKHIGLAEIKNVNTIDERRSTSSGTEFVIVICHRWTCRRWRNTSSVGVMLDKLRCPTLEARRVPSSLFFFQKIHCGSISIDKDK